jgi:lysophospholipase L1-like esterase
VIEPTRAPSDAKRKASLAAKLTLAVASMVVLVFVAELVCRVWLGRLSAAQFDDQLNMRVDFYRVVENSTRGFEIRPHATEEINSHGMRMREIPLEKPVGAYRVLVLGDSIAFGIGVPPEATFGAVLERRLRDRYPGRVVEVLNGGVISYNTEQQLDWLVERGMAFAPDAVVVAHCPNDVHATPIVFREGEHLRYFRPGADAREHNAFLIEHSALYRALLAMREIAKAKDAGTYRPNVDLTYNVLNDPAGQFGSLARLVSFARERSLPIVIVAFPYIGSPFAQYKKEDWDVHRGLLRTTTELGVPFIDLLNAWSATDHQQWVRPEAKDDFVHPNAAGHEDAAARLLEWFETSGTLER